MDTKKLIMKGWIEEDEEYSNVPKKCPRCGRKLRKTDSLKYCNMIMIYCMNLKCRFCEIYSLK